MPRINPQRLLADLNQLSAIGRFKPVHRPTYSEADQQARAWLVDRLRTAGLDAAIDGIGNVIGRSRRPGPRLLLGSHIESQPEAGRLDGALGVLMGLEVARVLRDDPSCAGLAVDVAAWADEEAYYGSFLGSRSFIGELTEADIDRAAHRSDGTPLRTALRAAGYTGPRATVEPGRYLVTLRHMSNRVTIWSRPVNALASSPASSGAGNTELLRMVSRTMRAQHGWRCARTPGWHWPS